MEAAKSICDKIVPLLYFMGRRREGDMNVVECDAMQYYHHTYHYAEIATKYLVWICIVHIFDCIGREGNPTKPKSMMRMQK